MGRSAGTGAAMSKSHLAGQPSDLAHSQKCADIIAAYYQRQGIKVEVYIESVKVSRWGETYPAVRSSLRMGWS